MQLVNNLQQMQSELHTLYKHKTCNVELASDKSKKHIDELRKEIDFLAHKHEQRSDIVLILWTGYLEMKEAYDEIKKRFLEYSKRDADDALKIVLEQLNYYKLKFENFINNKLNCANEKELFKKLVEILKQKVKVEGHLYNLMEDRNRIISENQVLKSDNKRLYLEMQHYKKIANLYHSDLVLPSKSTDIK
ncbi:uncharacterized protein [Centruroides vittatus]|uniref:uncharacterized protein isoform X2 n=1 Tax=Centruroides vittatus TaxID=120091 RepID=UPI00350EAFEB